MNKAMEPKDLLKKKNVILYYTGEKTIDHIGFHTGRTAIRVGVREKVPRLELKKTDIIPRRIQGVETDVFQTEMPVALAIDRKAKHRPAPGGISISHPNVTAGTLGMIVRKAGVRYILSNNHVLANSNEAEISDQAWQPGSFDGGSSVDTIGHLSAFVPIRFISDSGCLIPGAVGGVLSFFARLLERATGLRILADLTNKVDCAIARPLIDEDVLDEILEIGVPIGFDAVEIGDKIKKSGRTTGLTWGDVIAVDGVSNVNYGEGKIAIFEDQIFASAMSEGGDSGSAVLNERNEAVGLLFAGSSSLTIINKIANVIEALGLDKSYANRR